MWVQELSLHELFLANLPQLRSCNVLGHLREARLIVL